MKKLRNGKTEATFTTDALASYLYDLYGKDAKLKVETKDGVMTVKRAPLTRMERHQLAWRRLNFTSAGKAPFFYEGNVVVVTAQRKGYTKVGTAICAPDDTFDLAVGRVIAYERAKYGKVITKELL